MTARFEANYKRCTLAANKDSACNSSWFIFYNTADPAQPSQEVRLLNHEILYQSKTITSQSSDSTLTPKESEIFCAFGWLPLLVQSLAGRFPPQPVPAVADVVTNTDRALWSLVAEGFCR
jgi:hypothetical protein